MTWWELFHTIEFRTLTLFVVFVLLFVFIVATILEKVEKSKKKKNCKCKKCKSIKEGVKDIREGKITSLKSIWEWEKERDIWVKNHPILYKLEQTYYSIRRFFIRIADFFRYDIKYFIQRGCKGWSNRDWWNLPYYVSKIIVGCLKKLKKDGHGLPTWKSEKTEKQAVKEWDDILDNIIYTFEIAAKIGEGSIDYIPTEQKDKEKTRRIYRKIHKEGKKKFPDLPETTVLTEKESLRFEKGFQLFQKWFFHLWD